MKKQIKSITTNPVGVCSISLTLDRRTNKNTKEYPLSVYFHVREGEERKRYYHHLGEYFTEEYFDSVCSCTSSRSSLMSKRKELERILENYRERLAKVAKKRKDITIDLVKSCFFGTGETGESSFIQIWRDLIERLNREGRVGTAVSYQCALKSFTRIVGEVKGFSVNKTIVNKWDTILKATVSDATRGIYLRSLRVIWNEAVRQGFLVDVEYPFSNKDRNLVAIPRGKKRQQSYLNVEEMTKLYQVFCKRDYPAIWDRSYRKNVHESLGLFLVQYLCNGCNLADVARLKYNKTYWQEGGKAFEFERKKTAARSSDNSVVIVPIIEPLKKILDEIAVPPVKGGYVFPQIFRGETDEQERLLITHQENKNIRKRVRCICQEVLGWEKEVSGTWARHSFATNLKLAGIEEEYIAESMGHSHSNDVTAGYMDKYPLDIRFRNNMKLLKLQPSEDGEVDVDALSVEEMRKMLKRLLRN